MVVQVGGKVMVQNCEKTDCPVGATSCAHFCGGTGNTEWREKFA